MGEMVADVRANLPNIETELPGPLARAVLERDARVLSPSYTRTYPLVVRRGAGAIVEDVDGNRFLDFNAGIAVVATRALPPGSCQRNSRASGAPDSHVGHGLLLREHGDACGAASGTRARRCPAARLLRQFRDRSNRSRYQDGALSHRTR